MRSYSEGFEISKYLSRIEAITQRAPVTHKSRTQRANAGNKAANAKSGNESSPKARTNPQRPFSQRNNGPEYKRTPNGSNTSSGTRSRGPEVKSSFSARPTAESRLKTDSGTAAEQPKHTSRANGTPHQSEDAGWTTLDSSDTQNKASKLSARSNRRPPLRKGGLKAKSGKRGPAKKSSTAARNKTQHPSTIRERVPCLTPQEGLEVVLRNEGTSYGGYIEPLDVSLSSLQPNFVESAVTYNSRVRTLLNAIPPKLDYDEASLKALIEKYVDGKYDHSMMKSTEESLSYKSLASEVLANHSMDPTTRQFFAQVGAGKYTPKQIASR